MFKNLQLLKHFTAFMYYMGACLDIVIVSSKKLSWQSYLTKNSSSFKVVFFGIKYELFSKYQIWKILKCTNIDLSIYVLHQP